MNSLDEVALDVELEWQVLRSNNFVSSPPKKSERSASKNSVGDAHGAVPLMLASTQLRERQGGWGLYATSDRHAPGADA